MRSSWGGVRKQGNIWEIRYTVGGKAMSESKRTKKEADARLAALRVKYEGKDTSPKMTLGEYWTGFYEPQLKTPDYAESTVDEYNNLYRAHVEPAFSKRKMSAITPADVQKWLNTKSKGSAEHCRKLMSAIFTRAVDNDLILERNIMLAKYKLPTEYKRPADKSVYDLDEANAIFNECQGEYWEPYFILTCFGGCRRGEAVGCKAEDISIIEGEKGVYAVYSIKRGIDIRHGKIYISLKNENAERIAIIPPPYSTRLIELMPKSGWLIPEEDGGPINPNTMTVSWRRWFQKQPFRAIPWENMRNTYVTLMHTYYGVDIEAIRKLVGHGSSELTSRVYDRPTANMLIYMIENG